MIRGLWDRETVALLLLASLVPLAVPWLLAGGADAAGRLALAVACIAGWQAVWTVARAQPPSLAGGAVALAVAMLAPVELGAARLVLGLSFGLVMAELAFGGWGRNLLHPATVTLAFLGFGFPGAVWPEIPAVLGWAALPAAAIGVGLGILALDLVLGAALAWALALRVAPELAPLWPAFAVVLVLLVADPVASASTAPGRWANGALFAGLASAFAVIWTDAPPVDVAVSAALAASLAAPLLDEAVIAVWLWTRRRRHG